MTFVIPIAVAAALTVIGLMASRKDETKGPGLPIGPEPPPGGSDVHPTTPASAAPGTLPPGTTPKTGDVSTAHTDDAFDAALAAALAKGDLNALETLAKIAEDKGLLTVARSIRDEIARIKGEAPKATPPGPDKPAPTPTLATYIVKAGDTGSSIAKAYTGNPNRWPELVTVNPGSKDARYGFKANVGQRINIPASWPAGIPVIVSAPAVPPPPAVQLNTYTVQAGDTGEKVAMAFVGDKSRWKELLTVNPTLKSAQYGIALYTGHKIVLPPSWPPTPTHPVAALPAPVTAPTPPPPVVAQPPPAVAAPEPSLTPPPESPARSAARALTEYLTALGGLKARYKEDRNKVKAYQAAMGVTADGLYGVGSASAIMQNGFVPVVPLYWSSTNAATQKKNFTNLVQSFAAADPQRAAQWSALLADIVRS